MSDWWREVFTDKEVEQMELVAETIESEQAEALDETWMDMSIMFTMNNVRPVLEALKVIVESAWISKREEAAGFFKLLGYAIAKEYIEGDSPYDEPTADAAQYWYDNHLDPDWVVDEDD